MKTPIIASIVSLAILLAGYTQAQQSPSPQPVQPQTTPCTAAPSPAPSQKARTTPSIVDKWKKALDDKSAHLSIKTGIPLPNSLDLSGLLSSNLAPCPPKTATVASATVAPQPATIKLPPDTSVTLKCNPLTPSPQGGSRPTTLTLPDPRDFAAPKASDFLADSVSPDIAAHTPCYLIKVDPKTGKSFVQQP
jgi:hypothetical protein